MRRELVSFINGLNEEEQINLVALAWVGRGTYDIDEWDEARSTRRAPNTTSVRRNTCRPAYLCSAIISPKVWKPSTRIFDDEEDEEFEEEERDEADNE